MIRFACLLALPSILILSGCAGHSGRAFAGQELDAMAIFSSGMCEGSDQSPGAAWIADKKGLISFMDKINRLTIGGSSDSPPAVDFEHAGVLLIRMGRKPTSGYGIELASNKVDVRDRTAIVTIRWIEPPEGSILAQMITSPCIMIKMARGNCDRVRVVDQEGTVRAETTMEMKQN